MLKHNVGDSPLLNRNCSPILNRPLQYSSPSQSKTLSSPLMRNKVQKTSSPMLSPLTINTSGAETTDHRFTSEEELNEERKREIAEEILKRSESRKIRKIKQQAEAKVEQEVKLLREQSKQQHLDRLRVFEKSEQQEVEAVRQAAISLEATHHAKSQRKKRLLAKLFSLYAKQRANEVAFENAQNDKLLISLNQVVDSAKTKTREYIEEKSENHNTYLKDHFIKNFEKFICIPKEQEYKEIRESITEYISPAITKIKEEHELAQHSHKLLCNNEKEKYFNTLANKVREYHDHQFNICCSQKVEEINRGKNIIQLTADEITEFLEADIEEYETAIGVVDAELDRMKKRFLNGMKKYSLKKSTTTSKLTLSNNKYLPPQGRTKL
ncbi:hypothetical protein C9374_005403 [Naegleria lovaniensis]|uniref:Uncharacterized protein n=1 Tax=Naegleria lovaniensis TaxID=51637 RepID=A0AA88GJM4_NAELO|nr:uncharacterized protein C9374_005403 [Naegleria lovaniensis]KAG2382201.1 hypothetical protein C9374_005403 [Naegleria lovaniensis]